MAFHRIAGLVAATVVFAGAAPRAACAQTVTYTATMTGAQATPATQEKGTGKATFTLSGTKLTYTISVDHLTGPATAAHIHVGKPGVAGGPVYTFTINKVADGKLASGEIDLTKPASTGVSGDSLKALLNNGNAYVNVHTAAHPGGEIRGQIVIKK